MHTPSRGPLLALTAIAAMLAVSIPALAASPSPSPSAVSVSSATSEASAKAEASAKPEKSAKPSKAPETSVTLKGTVQQGKDEKGRGTFTMTVDGVTWTLSDGPPWFWGDKDPLAAYAGKTVTVTGTTEGSGHEVDVETVDGKAIRSPGKPPWAGGPWVVGPSHPGWKPWMADGKPGHGQGRDKAPGQLKKASPAPSPSP